MASCTGTSDKIVDRQRRSAASIVSQARPRQRVARGEQRAAVLIGNDRDGIRPDLVASAIISSLSIPISGRKTGSVTHARPTARFSSVCEATWPTTSPVTSACALRARAIPLGDAHHQPAVDDHAHRARHREQDLLLNLPEGNEIEMRLVLPLSSATAPARAPSPETLGTESDTVKMHEGHRAAALHQAVRGDGRIDPAGQEARRRDRRCPVGRPAGSALLAEEIERLIGRAARR